MFLSASSRIPFSMQNISIKKSISILLKATFCLLCDLKEFFCYFFTSSVSRMPYSHTTWIGRMDAEHKYYFIITTSSSNINTSNNGNNNNIDVNIIYSIGTNRHLCSSLPLQRDLHLISRTMHGGIFSNNLV